jgi:hypothetical protein
LAASVLVKGLGRGMVLAWVLAMVWGLELRSV